MSSSCLFKPMAYEKNRENLYMDLKVLKIETSYIVITPRYFLFVFQLLTNTFIQRPMQPPTHRQALPTRYMGIAETLMWDREM